MRIAGMPSNCCWQELLLLLTGQRQAVRSRCSHLAPYLLLLLLLTLLDLLVVQGGDDTGSSYSGMLVCMLLYPPCSAASPRGFGPRERAVALCFNCAAELLLLLLCLCGS
jgi:hypothetical protein